METNARGRGRSIELPTIQDICAFDGYDAISLMKETAKLRKLITNEVHLKS